MDTLDVKGLSCPIPVIKTKKALEKGCQELQVTGTGNVARENVSKYASSQGFEVKLVNDSPDEWYIILSK
ncbi:MAG: sulfurtransferase TusA family protein [Syntrophomonas sp.]|nr:sulfurtransferase TusA family protein [Syntrophomonas sp.]